MTWVSRFQNKMPKRFVNVKYGETHTRVKLADVEDLSEVQIAVKEAYGPDMADVGAAQLRFFDQQSQPIEDLDDIPEEYFQKPKNGGLFLVIHTTPPVSRQSTQLELVFQSCQIPFYNNLRTIVEHNGWLQFHVPIPSTKLKRLYIRSSYRSIASSIMDPSSHLDDEPEASVPEESESEAETESTETEAETETIETDINEPYTTKAIVTGTPGIGKSLFLLYLLWKLVKAGKRVLLIYHPDTIYFDGNGGVFFCPENTLPSNNEISFWNDDLWCLFDAKEKEPQDLGRLPYSRCSFVLSTSPRREMVNDYKKSPTIQIFYMPVWTNTELQNIAPCFGRSAGWHKRFKILGGIPRHVLERPKRNPKATLRAACNECSLNDCIRIIDINSEITEKTKVVHSLIHITSEAPYIVPSVSYASTTAFDIILKIKEIEAKRRIRELLASCSGEPLTASLCGYIFEQHAIDMLEKGGKFTCRQLVDPESNKKRNYKISIPKSKRIVVARPERNQKPGILHVPRAKNHTAIDAWIPGKGVFQMTVSERHSIHERCKEYLSLFRPIARRLYWMLPPLYFETFQKQEPLEIAQYAILIPYPSVAE